MMQADRIMFVAAALHEGEKPLTRPERLRLCIELERIAIVVRRMERQLDGIVAQAQDEAALIGLPRRRQPPKLRLVRGRA